jgi:hypothetical protein
MAEYWDKKKTLDQKLSFLEFTDYSYRRLGLVARPLEIYTSGGVEKGIEKKFVEPGVKIIKSRRSEAIIKHHPDGSTSVVYPDSDDEDGPLQSDVQEETPVIKG